MLKGETIQIYNYGNYHRDFTYVDDMVRVMGKSLEKRNGNHGLPIRDLIYAGMTDKQGFKSRICQHIAKDHTAQKKHIYTSKEQLVYAIAPMSSQLLQIIEVALIYNNQPKANIEYVDHYQGEYAEVIVICKGYHGGMLKKSITARFGEQENNKHFTSSF